MIANAAGAVSAFESAIRAEVQTQITASEEEQVAEARAATDFAREKLLELATKPILVASSGETKP